MKDDEFRLLRPAIVLLSATLTVGIVVRACQEAAAQRAQFIQSLPRTTLVSSQPSAPATNDCPAKSIPCSPFGKGPATVKDSHR